MKRLRPAALDTVDTSFWLRRDYDGGGFVALNVIPRPSALVLGGVLPRRRQTRLAA